MSENSMKRIIAALLLVTVVISAYILAVDNILWTYNPSHAYGLVLFMVVDLLLIGIVLRRPRLASYLTMVWGGLQFVVMIGDAATGLGLGADMGYSFRYLFLGEGNPSGLATSLLLVVYVVIGLISLFEVVTLRRAASRPSEATTSPQPAPKQNGRRPSV